MLRDASGRDKVVAGLIGARCLRVAHVTATFPPYWGGTGNVAYQNALQLARRGHQVQVLTSSYGSGPVAEPPNVVVRRFRPLVRLGNAPFVPEILRLDDVDIIHLHYPFIFGAEMVWAVARRRRIPYVLTYHNDPISKGMQGHILDAYTALIAPRVIGDARKLAVVSHDHAVSSLLSSLTRQRGHDVVEIPNSVDVEVFRPDLSGATVRERFKIPASVGLILFVGALDRAHYFKGLPQLLDIIPRLRARRSVLLVAGDGDLRSVYARLANDLGIKDRVIFAGAIPHERLPPFYAASDLVVLPSFPPESFGLVLIEGMACGKPVIAHDIPGVRRVVDNEVDGFLVKPGDVDDLTDKIDLLLADPVLRETMGKAGRQTAEGRFNAHNIGARLEELYYQVLGLAPACGVASPNPGASGRSPKTQFSIKS